MRFTNQQDIYNQYPLVKDISERLDASVKATKKERKDYVVIGQPTEPEHFIITRYKKNIWIPCINNSPQVGGRNFIKAVEKCMNRYDPDIIEVKLCYPSKRAKIAEFIPINFTGTDDISEIRSPQTERNSELSGQSSFNEDVFQMKMQLELIKKEAEHNLQTQRTQIEHDKIVRNYEDEIEKLKKINDEQEEYIGELEEDLENIETEGHQSLLGIQDEYEKRLKEKNAFVPVIAEAGEKLLRNFIIKNPQVLDGFGLSEEVKKSLLNPSSNEQLGERTQPATGTANDASFEQPGFSIDDELKGKDKKHIAALKNMWGWLKTLPQNIFAVVYEILLAMTKTDGTFDDELAEKIRKFIDGEKAKKEAENASGPVAESESSKAEDESSGKDIKEEIIA